MKVKIRPHNLPAAQRGELERAAREYIAQELEAYSKKLKWILLRRMVYAVCLALSDQYGFGSKRCQRVVDGAVEIITGVSEDVYRKGEIDPDGVDKAADNMLAELADRGIEIVIEGDDLYDDTRKINERKEKEIASGAGTRGSDKVITQ